MAVNPTFLEFKGGCISGRAIDASLREASMPKLPASYDALRTFDRHGFNASLRDLEELVDANLARTFRNVISPRYSRGAEIGMTHLRNEDVEDLCMTLLRTIGEWRNPMFTKPDSEIIISGGDLGPSNAKLDMTEFSRHLRNEVFADLQTKYGWGKA